MANDGPMGREITARVCGGLEKRVGPLPTRGEIRKSAPILL
jgi:hypothetical protein